MYSVYSMYFMYSVYYVLTSVSSASVSSSYSSHSSSSSAFPSSIFNLIYHETSIINEDEIYGLMVRAPDCQCRKSRESWTHSYKKDDEPLHAQFDRGYEDLLYRAGTMVSVTLAGGNRCSACLPQLKTLKV
jgi:hypothetical protein